MVEGTIYTGTDPDSIPSLQSKDAQEYARGSQQLQILDTEQMNIIEQTPDEHEADAQDIEYQHEVSVKMFLPDDVQEAKHQRSCGDQLKMPTPILKNNE